MTKKQKIRESAAILRDCIRRLEASQATLLNATKDSNSATHVLLSAAINVAYSAESQLYNSIERLKK